MANGYMEKILRVDLSRNGVREEPFPEDWKKKYLGGSGVGARIIYDEVPPDVDAFDPRNVVTLFVGPYSASPAPMSGRYGMATKSPLTGGWDVAGHGARLRGTVELVAGAGSGVDLQSAVTGPHEDP